MFIPQPYYKAYMPKEPLTREEEIKQAVHDLEVAMLEDWQAKLKEEEVAREKTKTHYNLIKARQRLDTIQ